MEVTTYLQMRTDTRHWLLLLLKLVILALFFMPFLERAMAVDELLNLYDSPQGLAMGNALSADAEGYSSLYYNPAGLAKAKTDKWTFTPLDLEGAVGEAGAQQIAGAHNLGIFGLQGQLARNPFHYTYFRSSVIPSVTHRNFGIALLGSYYYAGQSDGGKAKLTAGEDLGPSFGTAIGLWGNRIKLGVSIKCIERDQIDGTYAQSDLGTQDAVRSQMKEGFGVGADLGMLFSLPIRYLPTLGLVWHDVGDTRFYRNKLLNPLASGVPANINQSYAAAFSFHPSLGKGWRSTVSFEMRNIERKDLPWRKLSHFGMEFESTKNFFFWIGLNQLYGTGGFGYRAKGGDLELGTYSEDIGEGTVLREDRRFFFRYTISF